MPRMIVVEVALLGSIGLLAAGSPGSSGVTRRQLVVTGTVYDSLSRAPLAGAEVQLLRDGAGEGRRAYDARTDERGRFRVEDVEPGAYLAGAFHPRLDSLGVEVPTRRVSVTDAPPAPIALAVPSRETILRTSCPLARIGDASTLVHGTVLDARTRAPRGGAVVAVEWNEVAIGRGGLASNRERGVVTTGADGLFAICNAPGDAELLVRAAQGADTSGVVLMRFGADRIIGRDLFVGPASPADTLANFASPGDSVVRALAAARRGAARLGGTVRATTGQPLPGARVAIWGSAGEAVTGEDGSFSLAELPAGTHTLEARALGYEPARIVVDLLIAEGASNIASVVLERHRAALDTVRVIASADLALVRSGFEARRRTGLGHFIDRAMLDQRQPFAATNAIQTLPGLKIRPTSSGRVVLMTSGLGETCTPTVFLDGSRYEPRSAHEGFVNIDQLIDPERIAGIEVYARSSEAPLQFAGTTAQGCGVIVIWSRALVPEKR